MTSGAPGTVRVAPLLVPGRIVSALLFCVFAVVVIEGLRYPPEARLFPTMIGVAGMALAAAVFVFHGAEDTGAPADGAGPSRGRRLLAVLSAPTYSVLVWVLGFYAASLAALTVLPLLLGFRGALRLMVFAVASVALLAAIFSWGMEMSLPAGLAGDWFLHRFVYDR